MSKVDYSKFANLTFNDFRNFAKDPTLSRHEKVGFPDNYRDGKEEEIFNDVQRKIESLSLKGGRVLEIGPGCSRLPIMLAALCERNNHQLFFVDSEEMLSHLPDAPYIRKYAGTFPDALDADFDDLAGTFDVIIAYSVIQYVFAESNLWNFLDRCLLLLAGQGEIFLGDIPNVSMRKRFFSSNAGYESHRKFTGKDEKPVVVFNQPEPGQIDDAVVFSILSRARAQGFHAWVMPQAASLPMANRREDILIRKP